MRIELKGLALAAWQAIASAAAQLAAWPRATVAIDWLLPGALPTLFAMAALFGCRSRMRI